MTSPIDGKVVPFGIAVDKFHAFLHEPAGDIDTESGSMPNLRKLSNELRDIAASTAEGTAGETAAAIEDRIYPGVYSTPPTNKPHSGEPSAEGDRCIVLVGGVPTEHIRAGGGWLIPNFDAQQLAQAATLPMMAFSAVEAQSIFDNALPLATYADLLAYEDRAAAVRITGVYGTSRPGIAGRFRYNPTAPNTTDGGTRFAHASGAGAWEREEVEYVFLPWFGAVGDGIADDTAAIVAAIASLPATGGEIYTGRGKFLFSSTITINKPIVFRGAGAGSVNNGPAGTVLLKSYTLNGDGIALASLGASLATLTIQGQAGNSGDGVALLESRCVLDQISVFAAGRDNYRIGRDAAPSNVNLWQLWRCKGKNAGRHGLHISDKVRPTLPDANAGLCYGGDFQLNGECGVYLGNCAFNKFDGLCVQQNGTYGLRCSPSSMNNKFVGGDFEVNGRVGGSSATSYFDIWIEPGSADNDFDGCNCYNFPVTFKDEGTRTKIDGLRAITLTAGDDQYAGVQLPNKESAVPTVLDVYDEGNAATFVPVVKGSVTAGAAGAYPQRNARITRIGNIGALGLQVTCTGHTGTGTVLIDGLPWTSASFGFQVLNVVPGDFSPPANTCVVAMVPPSSKSILLYTVSTSGGVANPVQLPIASTMTFRISGPLLLA